MMIAIHDLIVISAILLIMGSVVGFAWVILKNIKETL